METPIWRQTNWGSGKAHIQMWRPLFGRVGRIGLYGPVYPVPGLATKNTEKVRDATTVFAFSVLVVTSTLSPEEVPKMVYLCASEVQFQKCQVGLRQATFCAANLNMYA